LYFPNKTSLLKKEDKQNDQAAEIKIFQDIVAKMNSIANK